MGAKERLDHSDVRAVVVAYRDALRAHQDRLNRLNVYPVPDGDTGTNMALTLESVVESLPGPEGDMAATCTAIAQGSLMGARGNSGVILSQILRGLSTGMKEGAVAGMVEGSAMAASLVTAAEAAYKAVMAPVEGTMLTVVREAAAAAEAAHAEGSRSGRPASLVQVLEAARDEAAASLERTPDLLRVLAQAGVVDAGGAGLVLLLDALLTVVDDRPLPEAPPITEAAAPSRPVAGAGAAAGHGGGGGDEPGNGIGPRYEIMFFLEAADDSIEEFKQAWKAIGESIAVVGGDGLWNCHIHADDIGAAIDAGIEAGRPRKVRVTDLAEQVDEQCHPAPPAGVSDHAEDAGVATGVVAVGAGSGIAAIFRSLGASQVVAGGRSANPSTAEILAAVEAVGAREVIVLTNDKNVVPVAEQVPALASKPVHVVPTRSVPQGFAAMAAYDAGAGGAVNAEAMHAALAAVATGELTHAVRAASTPAGAVNEGDWLGLVVDEIVVVEADMADALCALLERLVDPSHEVVTLVEGDSASTEATTAATAWVSRNRPGAEVEVHSGGQPLSAYLVSSE